MRCSHGCCDSIYSIPDGMPAKRKDSELTEAERSLLRCPACGALARPHVLFWDESYNEKFYRLERALLAASETALLIVVGTAGATTLPHQVAAVVANMGNTIIDINIRPNVFSKAAFRSPGGMFCRQSSVQALPVIARLVGNLTASAGH